MQKDRTDGRVSIDDRQRILLLSRPIGYIQKGAATVDEACHLLEVNRFLLPRCKSVRFMPGVAKKLEQEEVLSKLERWPGFRKLYLRTFQRILDIRRQLGMTILDSGETAEMWFEWWLSDRTQEQTDENQMDLWT